MTDISGTSSEDERLLQALVEQLKSPLIQIARRAELAQPQSLEQIETTANFALKLIDNYVLSTRLKQVSLLLEPVSISAVLYDALDQLQPIAKQYQCDLELNIAGKYGPVMAHRQGLLAAMISLGHAFIEAGQATVRERYVLTLVAHSGRYGTTAGVFSNIDSLSQEVFKRGQALYGRARQPLQTFTATSGAGVFVANSLFGAMSVGIGPASFHKTAGLAATFIPSRQLSMLGLS